MTGSHQTGFQRAREFWRQEQTIQVVTNRRLVPYLADELKQLGFPVHGESAVSVQTRGDLEAAMTLNLSLRTGHRVLMLLESFEARNDRRLSRKLGQIDWESFLSPSSYLTVNSSVEQPGVTNARYVNMMAKDAIVDRIRHRCGQRPDSGPERTGAVVFLRWSADRCWVYLDTSGQSLARRSYRLEGGSAPMQETLAAAVVKASGWDGTTHFVNPMCGSGTLAIEAAMLAAGRAPGLLRNEYGFLHLYGTDRERWATRRREAQRHENLRVPLRIVATDRSKLALRAARQNAERARVADLIEFRQCDFRQTRVPDGKGVILFNPEYGERLGETTELEGVYRQIGDFLKQEGAGYQGGVFTGNRDLAKLVGLKPSRRIPFFNGRIDCRLFLYELYSGSRRELHEETGRGS